MQRRVLLFMVILAGLGIIALDLLQRRMELGRFAESPQILMLARSQRMIAGGGRAIVGTLGFNEEQITLEVQCKDTFETLDLKRREPPREVPGCGIRIDWFGAEVLQEGGPARAILEVSWDPEPEIGAGVVGDAD